MWTFYFDWHHVEPMVYLKYPERNLKIKISGLQTIYLDAVTRKTTYVH